MSEPWLLDLGATFIASVAPADTAAVTTAFATLQTDVADFTTDQFEQLRGTFTAATMTRSLAPALLDPQPATAAVVAAVGAAQAVLEAPGATLAALLAQMGPLQAVRDAAWKACQISAGAVRTAKAAEKIAAIAAATGFPGATQAWAVATNLRMGAEVVAEAGAAAGRAADQAFGGLLHSVDALRRTLFAPINAVSRVAHDAVSAMTAGVDDIAAIPAAYSTLFGDLQAAVVAVA